MFKPPVSDIGFGRQLLANKMNASNPAYTPSDLLSVRFLKSLVSFSRPGLYMAAAGEIPFVGLVVYTIPSTESKVLSRLVTFWLFIIVLIGVSCKTNVTRNDDQNLTIAAAANLTDA